MSSSEYLKLPSFNWKTAIHKTDGEIICELRSQIEKQSERIEELEAERGDSQFCAGCNDAAKTIEKQAAALKLASLALSEGVEYVEEPPEKNCSCHLSPPCNDCVDHSAVREFFMDARKALAAIDALKGE